VGSIDPNTLMASINSTDIDDVLSGASNDVSMCPVITSTELDNELIANTTTDSLQRFPSSNNLMQQQSLNNDHVDKHFIKLKLEAKKSTKRGPTNQHVQNNEFNSRPLVTSLTSDYTINTIQRCYECGKTFTNKSALAKHKLIHSSERKYMCCICDKSFKRQDHLNGHMLTHQDVKPFKCKVPTCEKSYCDSRSLKRHIESQHQDFLASLANGRVEALNFLPPIGKINANIGPNIQETIFIEPSKLDDAATTAKLPIVKSSDLQTADSLSQTQLNPVTAKKAFTNAYHKKSEIHKKDGLHCLSYNFFT
jgi:hypothetical protein